MSTYKTIKAFNHPVTGEYTPIGKEITKEDFEFLSANKFQNYVSQTGIVAKVIRSAQELIADILDSASYLTQETLGETIEILQKNLRAMAKVEETKPTDTITETKPEIKAKK
jgi:hypothetical protein